MISSQVHVPEDEALHRVFHHSAAALDFKGWEKETHVMEVLEWGVRGRIIAITTADTKNKVTKSAEVLKLADLELGFAPVPFDQRAITYLACNHHEIMGICLAQPLTEANKLISDFGIDFCSAETYPVR